ncbi:MAG TPA: nucleoside 2-deoxyribosyltransferase [Patescibacteria group bacterium]|nr:nucleoside 2-deoxyribosyltransferase [Patescibacteria group bacterium]
MKRVYFGCSIAGGRDHAHVYADIVKYIKEAGAEVISEMFADMELKPEVGMKKNPAKVYKRDVQWVQKADAFIAEVTQPSLGVGYEIAIAEQSGTPVLALFYTGYDRWLSPMITGNPYIHVFEYNDIKQTKKVIEEFIDSL